MSDSAPHNTVLHSIGHTALVRLQHVVPANCANVIVKLEWQNPTGSMKDRMALEAIARAEEDGRLRPGDTVVEYTGGSTGASLALVCAIKGYPIRIVTSTAFSREKIDHMAAYGAELTVLRHDGISKQVFVDMIAAAERLAAQPNVYWTNQLQNRDMARGYEVLGEEAWQQTQGHVDAFVQMVGTSHSLRGVAAALRARNPKCKIVAVEPAESAVLSGGLPGVHNIEGVGIGYVPPLWEPSLVDAIVPVSTTQATEMARRLAREEGLFAGTSSGANVCAAIEIAKSLPPTSTVLTLMIDSGLKYLSTSLYRRVESEQRDSLSGKLADGGNGRAWHSKMRYPMEKQREAVARLLGALPELQSSHAEHLADNDGELLPYMYFPDAVRDAQKQLCLGSLPPDFLDRFARAIEMLLDWDPGAHDLVGLGIIDELKEADFWQAIYPKLGPKSRAVAAEG
ncbi:MAG: cysteine synthase family protein [Candidatus Eremiobacteraeota bacterium]|nr:cysteine synthase family protein [Candidatus Eremiobacteraeota bacterium]